MTSENLKPHFFTKTDQKLVFLHKKMSHFLDETGKKSEVVSKKRVSFIKKGEFHYQKVKFTEKK